MRSESVLERAKRLQREAQALREQAVKLQKEADAIRQRVEAKKRGPEDASQAAARIVREATENH